MPFNLNAVKILTNNELWFGKPDLQNDPNEAEFLIKRNNIKDIQHEFRIDIQDELKYAYEKDYINQDTPFGFNESNEFEKILKKTIKDNIGICSMSMIHNHILMWAHYANNNEGICVVFNKEKLVKQFGEISENIYNKTSGKITYSKNIPNAEFSIIGNTGIVKSDKIFYMDKLDHWDYEEEYRFFWRFHDRFPINHDEPLKSFPENAIVGVILGEKFPIEHFKTIVNIVFSKDVDREFNFWKCSKNLRKNTMDMSQIQDKSSNFFHRGYNQDFERILNSTKDKLRKKEMQS